MTDDQHETQQNCNRVIYPLPDPPPTVSLIVPTRDQVKLLKSCVSGLLERTDYPDIEVIIADNNSTKPQTLSYLGDLSNDPRVTILKCPGPFNFSAINNQAVHQARGSIIGLINNDIEVIRPGWLREMVSHAVRPEVGAVGCKLLYGDGRIQHAGVYLDPERIAVHAFQYFPSDSVNQKLQFSHTVPAVTAACMLVRKDLYHKIGGFNAKHLPIAFNDVDFCLRLRQAGYINILEPQAELYHYESLSRGKRNNLLKKWRFFRERYYMRKNWPLVE